MKNRKMSSAITATVLLVNLVCIILFYLIANTTLTSLMKKSALKNLHTSLDVQTEIAKEYIRHQEDMLTTFSDSDVVRAFLKDPQNEQKKIAAQQYTERYYARLDNWEGLYISEWDTHIIAHSNPEAVGLVTREGEYRLMLQDAIQSRMGLYHAGIIVSPASGRLILSQYCPVFDEDGCTILGYVGGGPYGEELDDYLNSAQNKEVVHYLINVANRTYIFAQEEELMATEVEDAMLLEIIHMVEQDKGLTFGEMEYMDEEEGGSISAFRYLPEYGWVLISCDSEANIYADVYRNMWLLAVLCIVFELCIGVLSWICIVRATRPMRHIRDAITQLQERNLEKNPKLDQYINTSSEVGQIATAIDSFYDSFRDMLHVEESKRAAIEEGEAKARFFTGMSKEICTPIDKISVMNDMILRECEKGIIREYALNIKRESQLLVGLVNDMLDLAWVENGDLKLVEKAYEPAFVLYDTVLEMLPQIREKNLELVREIDRDIPQFLWGDAGRIRQILNNLISNAVKYTEQGKIIFHAEGEQREDTYWLMIYVEDTGIGIKPEALKRVFTMFQQREPDQEHYLERTAFGLSVTKLLVEHMGGTIQVESEYGIGSRFTVSLPQKMVQDDPALTKREETR